MTAKCGGHRRGIFMSHICGDFSGTWAPDVSTARTRLRANMPLIKLIIIKISSVSRGLVSGRERLIHSWHPEGFACLVMAGASIQLAWARGMCPQPCSEQVSALRGRILASAAGLYQALLANKRNLLLVPPLPTSPRRPSSAWGGGHRCCTPREWACASCQGIPQMGGEEGRKDRASRSQEADLR